MSAYSSNCPHSDGSGLDEGGEMRSFFRLGEIGPLNMEAQQARPASLSPPPVLPPGAQHIQQLIKGAAMVVRQRAVVPPSVWYLQMRSKASALASIVSRPSAPWMWRSIKPGAM